MENTRKILAFKYTGDYEQDFTDEHPLLIWMVAETVAENYDAQDPKDLEKYLLGKFSGVYRNNADFGKSILLGKGNTGRDKLYAFMTHWSDAYSKAEKSSKKPRDYESAVAIKAVKAAVETLEIQDVRQNPELYELTEEEANTWSDEEIEVFLEEYQYDAETAMPEFAAKKTAEGEGEILVSHIESDILDAEVVHIKENREEYEDLFADIPEDATEQEIDEKIQDFAVMGDTLTLYWEDEKMVLDDLLEERGAPNEYIWHVGGQEMGWQNRSGEKIVQIENADDFIEKIFPKTQDYQFELKDIDGKSMKLTVWHHDSPTGEFYTLTPVEIPADGTRVRVKHNNVEGEIVQHEMYEGEPLFWVETVEGMEERDLKLGDFDIIKQASKKTATIDVKLEDVYLDKVGLAEEAKKLIESYNLKDLEVEPGRYDIFVETIASDWLGIYQSAKIAEIFGIKDQLMAEIKESAKDDPDTLGNIRYDDVDDKFIDNEGEEVGDDEAISNWEFSWPTIIDEVAGSLADQLNEREQVAEPYDEGSWYFGTSESGGDYGLIYSFEMPETPEKVENSEQQTLPL